MHNVYQRLIVFCNRSSTRAGVFSNAISGLVPFLAQRMMRGRALIWVHDMARVVAYII
jgi:hypothetical protein